MRVNARANGRMRAAPRTRPRGRRLSPARSTHNSAKPSMRVRRVSRLHARRVRHSSALVLALVLGLAASLLLAIEPKLQPEARAGAAIAAPVPTGAQPSDFASFEENLGQFPADVHYALRATGAVVLLRSTSVEIGYRGNGSDSEVRMSWAESTTPVAEDQRPGQSNYLLGQNAASWVSGARTFNVVRYSQIAVGADLVFRATATGVEYDIELAPGASAADVDMVVDAPAPPSIMADGSLAMEASGLGPHHGAPRSFVETAAGTSPVASRYVVRDGNHLGFEVDGGPSPDRVVVDPVVVDYSTYNGGSGVESIYSLKVDSAGTIYSVGISGSANYPTQSPIQGTFGGGVDDVVVTKYAPGGKSRVYSTYLGGSGDDFGANLALAGDGSVVISGSTKSSNFPLANALYSSLNGSQDGFVAKLTPAGTSLVFSTFLGGSGVDTADGVALDPSGTVYLSGSTSSANFPKVGAFQATYGGGISDGLHS